MKLLVTTIKLFIVKWYSVVLLALENIISRLIFNE